MQDRAYGKKPEKYGTKEFSKPRKSLKEPPRGHRIRRRVVFFDLNVRIIR